MTKPSGSAEQDFEAIKEACKDPMTEVFCRFADGHEREDAGLMIESKASDPRAKLYIEDLWTEMARERWRIYSKPMLLSSRADFERQFGPNPITLRSRQLARDRNAHARRLLEDHLPRPLHFLLDRPKALRRVLRFVPRWRLTMAVVDLRRELPDPQAVTEDVARSLGRMWLVDAREAGAEGIDGGLIFTYTDPSGLLAEVYL